MTVNSEIKTPLQMNGVLAVPASAGCMMATVYSYVSPVTAVPPMMAVTDGMKAAERAAMADESSILD